MRRILPLLLPVLIASLAMAAPASAGGPIATVDIVRLIQAHPKFPELRKQYEDRQQKAKDYAKAEDTRLQKLKGELDLMTPNEPAFLQKQKEVAAGLQMLKFEMEWRETTAQREYVRGLEILYSEATLSVQSYVRTQQGLQLVLVKPPKELQSADFSDWGLKVQMRTVLYSDPSLDITDAIIATLPKAPPAPAPAPAPAGSGRPAGSAPPAGSPPPPAVGGSTPPR